MWPGEGGGGRGSRVVGQGVGPLMEHGAQAVQVNEGFCCAPRLTVAMVKGESM